MIAGRRPEHVSPEPTSDCPPWPSRDPESFCASSHISRTTSAFALPGIGYIPGFFSHDSQPCSPRYARLKASSFESGNNLGYISVETRYDSLPPSISRRELLPEAAIPADLFESDDPPLIRFQSVPVLLRPPQSPQLQSAQSASPQVQAWALPSLPTSTTLAEHSAASRSADCGVASGHVEPEAVSSGPQFTETQPVARLSQDVHSVISELVEGIVTTSSGTKSQLGAFDSVSFYLPSAATMAPQDDIDKPSHAASISSELPFQA